MRENFSSGAPWEAIVGYSRAVRIGNIIEVAGTTAVVDGELKGEGDAYEQTLIILDIIKQSLEKAGVGLQDVIRTRIYVSNINDWEKVGEAHGKVFSEIKPVTTLVEVSNLVDKRMLVEIEASAVIS